jgi:uncharacterized membrane protein (UPF0136 family)
MEGVMIAMASAALLLAGFARQRPEKPKPVPIVVRRRRS